MQWNCSNLLIFLLASISCRPQPPRIVVDDVGQHHLFGLHIDPKLNLDAGQKKKIVIK